MSRKDLNQDQRKQLAKLAELPDDQIDTLDIPEVPAENWVHARLGHLYRPLNQPVTIRLDADVLAWFKDHVDKGGGYQTEINRVLRHYVAEQERHRS